MKTYFHIYLDTKSGKTIAIRSKQKPKKRASMHVVYEWGDNGYEMAPFPEIPHDLLFSDRFIYLNKIQDENK